jgi:MOSC domain-containing protein YiiM
VTVAPVLLSVNVGLPKNVPWRGSTVHTGIWKRPVDGPALVRRLNIDGDGQGDLNGHGGEQRAVLVYQLSSYQYWQRHFGRDDLGYGMFGENLTVDCLPDDEVCVGDRYRIGEAEFEVTQPRVTCYRVGLRLGEPRMAALLVAHHRPGFYRRVITEGRIRAGDAIVKTRTGPGALSVADTDALLYLPDRDTRKPRTALQIPALSPGWQDSFRDLLRADEGHGPAGSQPAEPAWPAFRPLRVAKVVNESTDVSAPRGEFVLDDRAGAVLLISAGIGVTPVLSMLHQLAQHRSEREIWWLHGAPGPRKHPFAAEAHALLTALPHAREKVFFSAATPAERDRAHATRGRLTGEALASLGFSPDATAYTCGPASEQFGALPAVNPGVTRQTRRPPLEPPADGQVLICCAQPGTDLVLDM